MAGIRTQVNDGTPAYNYVLRPLLMRLSLPSWEGLTWGDINPQVLSGMVSFSRTTNAIYVATAFRRPTGDDAQIDLDQWSAFEAWLTWGAEVAKAQGLASPPREWFFFSTFPGEPYQIPDAWVRSARDLQITWYEWKMYCAVAKNHGVHYGETAIDEAYKLRVSRGPDLIELLARGEKTPEEKTGKRGPKRKYADFPAEWGGALEDTLRGLAPMTIRSYRSYLRRIVEGARLTPRDTPDTIACEAVAERLGPQYRSAWNRFKVELLGQTAKQFGQWRARGLHRHERAAEFDKQEARFTRNT